MRVHLLKGKIHRATVTETNLDYTGSITIDEDLMDAAGFLPYEKVLVADVTNGSRHETYVVKGKRGSGIILVMGAAAHLVKTNDKVIIMAFAEFEQNEIAAHKPKIVFVDEHNKQVKNSE